MSTLYWTRGVSHWEKDKQLLEGLNWPVVHVPSVRIESLGAKPPKNSDTYVLVTSQSTLSLLLSDPSWVEFLGYCRGVVTFGDGTANAIKKAGLPLIFLPASSGRVFGLKVCGHFQQEDKFLYLGTNQPAFNLVQYLKDNSFLATQIPVYQTLIGLQADPKKAQYLKNLKYCGVVCFASPKAVSGFCEFVNPIQDRISRLDAVAIGETTREAAEHHFKVVVQSATTSIESLLDTARGCLASFK